MILMSWGGDGLSMIALVTRESKTAKTPKATNQKTVRVFIADLTVIS